MKTLFTFNSIDISGASNLGTISLRPLTTRDASMITELIEVNHPFLSPWLSWAQVLPSRQQTDSFLLNCIDAEKFNSERHMAILLNSQIIGIIGCTLIDRTNKTTTIGFWLDRGRWDKGIMSACLKELSVFLIGTNEFNRIEVRCAIENFRGNRAAINAGFTHEGVLRQAQRVGTRYHDLNIYSLIRSDLKEYYD